MASNGDALAVMVADARAELLRVRDTAVEDMRAMVAHGDGSNTTVN